MSYQVPKDLKGEERLFIIPGINAPFYKKSIIYNGPATLISAIIGKITGNTIMFVSTLIVLNLIAYPLGNFKRSKKHFDNGFMDNDKLIKRRIYWRIKGGGNVYVSHKRRID